MIRVLNSWEDLGKSIGKLQKARCGYHGDATKNWDLSQINEIFRNYEKDIRILDMGCRASHILRFAYERGFRNCIGIDLSISIEDRLSQVQLMLRDKTLRRPYRLMKMNLMKTTFPDHYFDFIICLSVIEHGVNIDSFLKESSRILKNGGTLFVSTDYWEPKINTDDSQLFGLKWNIFSRREIEDLIGLAKNYGLMMDSCEIPPVGEQIIHLLGRNYTFISLFFRKM